jgi:gas vesicle protein
MANESGTGAGSVLLAFLLGAVTGAAVALLYAPATGRETREYLGEKARQGRDRASDAAVRGREMVKQGREMLDQGRQTLNTAIERGREAFQQARTRDEA